MFQGYIDHSYHGTILVVFKRDNNGKVLRKVYHKVPLKFTEWLSSLFHSLVSVMV